MKSALVISLLTVVSRAWAPARQSWAQQRLNSSRRFFFKDLLDKAFENDDSLTQDEKVTGQIEGANEPEPVARKELTETQQKWRQMNSQAADITGTSFSFDFFLTGIPDKDPSNDLFGARVNISSRDRKVGQSVPENPTVENIRISFLDNSKCICETDSVFTSKDSEGDWRVSDDGKQIRFRISVTGFTRTVETRGSIQSVFWSDEPDKVSRTATVYSIPEGWMYGEAELIAGGRPGLVNWNDAVLKVEQSTGLLGAGSKMVPCGIFEAKMATNAEYSEQK